MIEANPFLIMRPKPEDEVFGMDERKIKDYAKRLSEGGIIVIVSGAHGSGKSFVEVKIEDALPKKITTVKLVCSPKLVKDLKLVKIKGNTVIVIEKFHILPSLGETELKNVLDTVGEMLGPKISFLITSTPELTATLPRLSHKIRNVLVFDVPPLSFEDAKKLVASRLNKARAKPTKDISPFTENELMRIWKTSKGNPKLILLLCAGLYESKESS